MPDICNSPKNNNITFYLYLKVHAQKDIDRYQNIDNNLASSIVLIKLYMFAFIVVTQEKI